MSWIKVADKKPRYGELVFVRGIVRYGRKVQVLVAKYVTDYDTEYEWIAFRDGNWISSTTRMQKVIEWRPLTNDENY